MIDSVFDFEQAAKAELLLVEQLALTYDGQSRGLLSYAKREAAMFHLARLRQEMADYLNRGQDAANQERSTGD